MNKSKKQNSIKNLYIIKTTQIYNFSQPVFNFLKLPGLQFFINQLKSFETRRKSLNTTSNENYKFFRKWWFCLNFYKKLFMTPVLDNLMLIKSLNNTILFKKFYRLFFTFKKGRFFVNLTNFNKSKNYLFLSTGMFIQYFQYKKSLRKNKILKVLISKYLRKFLLILQLKYVSLHFSSTPIMLQEIILNLTTPLIKPLKNPLTLKVIDEDQSSQFRFIFLYFFFQKSKNFGTFKLRRKGRVKRRIIRKLIKINNVLD